MNRTEIALHIYPMIIKMIMMDDNLVFHDEHWRQGVALEAFSFADAFLEMQHARKVEKK
jgi:hypothetical protein